MSSLKTSYLVVGPRVLIRLSANSQLSDFVIGRRAAIVIEPLNEDAPVVVSNIRIRPITAEEVRKIQASSGRVIRSVRRRGAKR